MDIYNIYGQIDDAKEIVDGKNIILLSPYSGSQRYFSCTCGENRRISLLPPNECPKCKTNIKYNISDIENDACLMKIEHEKIQDDEQFVVWKICLYGLIVEEGNLDFDGEIIDDVIFFDKKNKLFGIAQMEESRDNCIYGELVDNKYISDEKIIAKIKNNFSKSYFFKNWQSTIFKEKNKYSGLKEFFEEINSYVKALVFFDEKWSFENIITSLYIQHNVKWYYSYKEFIETNNPCKFLKFNETSFFHTFMFIDELKSTGIKMDSLLIEDAFKMNIRFLQQLNNISEFVNTKKIYEKLVKENLLSYYFDYVLNVFPEIKAYHLQAIDIISESYQKPYSVVFKYFIRSMVKGFDFVLITSTLKMISDFGDKNIVEFNRTFSYALEKKDLIIRKNIMTLEQIEKIQKNPTLTTVFNTIFN